MSALGSPDAMKTFVLRSTTPASNEKVMLYLEGMERDRPDSSVHSPIHRSRSVASSARRLGEGGDGDDIRSDIQEGRGSDVARTIPIQTTGHPDEHDHEPDDPPVRREKFESYGSSFGNFGPLRDSLPNGGAPWGNGQPWTSPSKAAGVPLPETQIGSEVSHPNPFQQFGMAPVSAAGVPLPTSVMSGDPLMSPKTRQNGTASRASQKAMSNGVASPKAPSRVMSPSMNGGGGGGASASPERPWSPRSSASQGQKSRVTQKSSRGGGTAYPPLPDSVMEEGLKSPTMRAESPPLRSHSKTPSISPSDSASQFVRVKRSNPPPPAKELSHKPPKSLKSIAEVPSVQGEGSQAGGSHKDGRPMSPRSNATQSALPNHRTGGTSHDGTQRGGTVLSNTRSKRSAAAPSIPPDVDATPTPSRPASPDIPMNAEEERMVEDILKRPARTRTSYALSAAAPSMLEPEIAHSHFHDGELCQLLHALDAPMSEPVKKAVRKAVRTRVKKLGMKYDIESIKQYRKSYHDHDPSVHMMHSVPPSNVGGLTSKRSTTQVGSSSQPPEWAKDLIEGIINVRERLDNLAPQIERSLRSSRGGSYVTEGGQRYRNGQYGESEMNGDEYAPRSPMTQTTHMLAHQQTGTMGDESMYHTGDTEAIRDSTHVHTLPGSMHHHDGSMHGIPEEEMYEDEHMMHPPTTHGSDTRGVPSEYMDREDSSGRQYLEEELYKLRIKPGTRSEATHKTWELARDNGEEYDEDDGDAQAAVTESGIPEITDDPTGYERSLPPLPPPGQAGSQQDTMQMPQAHPYQPDFDEPRIPPWQKVHQRLLSWAIVWPMSELDEALNSTTRGMQVNEVALSIWSTQTYKRYVRAKMTDNPPGHVDRLFVPPNMADAISTAVYNGRHGDACGMLRDLWAPFGLEGIPRLLIVLAKHRNDENHWVVHRFSLPDGSLTTYDTYPERCLPDGRPLGWWFAIRIAWPDAIYPSPDHLMQKMVRLHRPMQLSIDNSVAAAGIWRNLLMGSRAERSLDLERLRDLINTEVKNLRQRKQMGKLSIGSPRLNWEETH
ncbi:hypothetical protein K474DRAFT_1655795 [Panus rudis PR-1116 ss-1]|nr:hypothetical protein K474DRAFT_1655795 [Panus rudis PR-1116 ss-1]